MTREPETPSLLQRRIYGTVGIAVLVALYLLVGLVGHDPWRGDDARYLGPILSMLRGEGWLFPMLAGEPPVDYPPLYYWVGALLAWAGSGFLALHEGARLASAVFVAIGVYFSARTAEALYGRPARTPAALLTMGGLGLVLHAHEIQPLLAVLAMLAMSAARPRTGAAAACSRQPAGRRRHGARLSRRRHRGPDRHRSPVATGDDAQRRLPHAARQWRAPAGTLPGPPRSRRCGRWPST
ncbi:hypothetical protein [Thauera humireducens]|uniref:ArnT family glycosyltransferase n=1 Tax=Thauera humireducens TaxID=1134435 RepID=UPI00311F9E57